MSRLAVHRLEAGEPLGDVINWLDRALIRFMSKFASFKGGSLASFRMPPQISRFPAVLYHLRRSQFLQSTYVRSCSYIQCAKRVVRIRVGGRAGWRAGGRAES